MRLGGGKSKCAHFTTEGVTGNGDWDKGTRYCVAWHGMAGGSDECN